MMYSYKHYRIKYNKNIINIRYHRVKNMKTDGDFQKAV